MPKIDIPEGWTVTRLGGLQYNVNNKILSQADNIEGWKTKMLGELITLNTGKLDSNRAENNGSFPFFTCAPNPLKINSYAFNCDAILLAGNNANGIFHINRYNGKFNAYQRTYVITTANQNIDIDFLYYSLQLYLNYLKDISQGSATKFLTVKILKDIKIDIPIDIKEQKQIAKILSSLDDKIELLREQNKTLEAIAQAIYKQWFVDFEFPIEDETSKLLSLKRGEPEGRGGFDNILQLKGYKSSGGKMVKSELGEIPEGWKVIKINELFDFIKGVEPGSANYFKYKISDYYIPFYRVQNISDNSNVPNVFIEKSLSNNKLFDKKDILVSLDGTIGKVFIGGQGSYSSGIRKVISKNNVIGQCLIYCFLKSDYFQNGLILFSSGETTIKHAGKTLENLQIVYKHDIFEQFTKNTNSIFEKMIINLQQIQTLSDLRDSLLPKLMSGKIRVPVKNEAETTLSDGARHSSLTEEGPKSENPQT